MIKNLKTKIAKFIDCNNNCSYDIQRASRFYHRGGVWRYYAFLLHRRNRNKYNIEVYPEAKIGTIQIPHCVGIVVGRTAEIGDGTILMPNVVIGAKYSSKYDNQTDRRHAVIGKKCLIGANSTIIGNITIGDNVTVGAGAIVTCDVPSDCIVVSYNKILIK